MHLSISQSVILLLYASGSQPGVQGPPSGGVVQEVYDIKNVYFKKDPVTF